MVFGVMGCSMVHECFGRPLRRIAGEVKGKLALNCYLSISLSHHLSHRLTNYPPS